MMVRTKGSIPARKCSLVNTNVFHQLGAGRVLEYGGMVYNGNPMKIYDLGVPYFRTPPYSFCFTLMHWYSLARNYVELCENLQNTT